MKQRIKNWLFGKFVRVVIPQDIISQDQRTKVISLGGKPMTENELRSLQNECKALSDMRIWSILSETVKQQAFDTGWTTSTTMEHLNTAKTMYHTIDLQQSIINIIKNKDLTQKG